MSVVAVSSYFLWTQKGFTRLPLIRGSGFVVAFAQQHAFYRYHVVTAAHVACPTRYARLFGNSIGLRAIGERHVTCRALTCDSATGRVAASLDLVPAPHCHVMPTVDVVSLRCAREEELRASAVVPQEMAPCTLAPGTRLRFCGVVTREDRKNPSDDLAQLLPCTLRGTCRAAMVTADYGTVFVATLDRDSEDDKTSNSSDNNNSSTGAAGTTRDTTTSSSTSMLLPLSMCGGAVLRESDGKCVGVIVARVKTTPTPHHNSASSSSSSSASSARSDDASSSNDSSNEHTRHTEAPLCRDPYLDLSEQTAMHSLGPLDVAFAPLVEFYDALRRCEM